MFVLKFIRHRVPCPSMLTGINICTSYVQDILTINNQSNDITDRDLLEESSTY